MIKFIAHDKINDVAVIQTSFGYSVRYGLQVTPHDNLHGALLDFRACIHHAIAANGLLDLSNGETK